MKRRKPYKNTRGASVTYAVAEENTLLEFLLQAVEGKSRNKVKGFLSRKQILVNDVPISQFDFKLYKGDEVKITPFPNKRVTQTKLKIIYEDDEIIVIDKPSGLLTIATDKEKEKTAYRLVNEHVQFQDKNARIFIVHRLDQDTSGVLMFAKNNEIKNAYQKNWNNIVEKRGYYAVTSGVPKEEKGVIKSFLHKSKTNQMFSGHKTREGKYAETHYEVVKHNSVYALLAINIMTGRKNQIRVHLKDLECPVVGDVKYEGPKSPLNRLGLHAYELKIHHPITNKLLVFKAKEPTEFHNLVK